MSFNSIEFIGLGYIGLPTAVLLAAHGKAVIGVDINDEVVQSINAGKLHIVEPDLDVLLTEVVSKGFLRATTKPEPADAIIIAVPTPFKENHKPDISYIKAVSKSIAPILSKGNLIILESTSPVGTTEQLEQWLAELRPDLSFPSQAGEFADICIAYCPERVLPGNILHELVHNERIVGGLNKISAQKAEELYKFFVKGAITHTTARTAEMCKLTENSSRDVNIAFANELSMICHELDINVWELIALANKHPRVSILQPSCGVGGHCIAVDPWFIVDKSPKQAKLIRTAREVNDLKPQWVIEKIKAQITEVLSQNPQKKLRDVSIACLGLAFKPNIDDLRESPAMEITGILAEIGCKIIAVEPNITSIPKVLANKGVTLATLQDAQENADILCILVKHHEFINMEIKQKFIIDTVNAIKAQFQ